MSLLLYEFIFPKDYGLLVLPWDVILPLNLSDSAEGILPGVTDFDNFVFGDDCEDSGGEFHPRSPSNPRSRAITATGSFSQIILSFLRYIIVPIPGSSALSITVLPSGTKATTSDGSRYIVP